MRRKAGAGRPPPEIGRLTAAKAVRSAVVQAADEVAGLPVTAGLADEVRTTLEPFVADLPQMSLLALVEGPGARFGLVVLDAQAMAALIEMQTTGRVAHRPAEPRAPTRTDAIICADFIDRVLELLEQRVTEAELDVAPAVAGFRYGLALAEPRAVVMTLEDIAYRAFRFELDLGRGAKSGAMQILLPYEPPGARRAGAAEAEAFAEAMRAQVLETQANLTATLFRRRMTLADLVRLEVGSTLVLPREALERISVEAMDGTVVAHGRLGQANGCRAVRLTLGKAARPMEPAPTQTRRPQAAPLGAASAPPRLAAPGTAESRAAPDPGGSAELESLGDLGNLGDAGSLGDLGNFGDGGGLGDLGDLGDLSNLGDLGSISE